MDIGIARAVGRMAAHQNRLGTTDPQQRVTQGIVSSLPYLRAGWTMGQIDYQNPFVMDINGNTYPLTANNGPVFGVEQDRPSIYAEFDGLNQYLSRADGGVGNWADILGTETQIPAGQRGLTFGGWFKFDRLTNNETLIAKSDGTVAQTSYILQFRGDLANDPFRFIISSGAASFTVTLTFSQTVATGRWYFVCGRYTPATEIKIYVGSGGALESNVLNVGIPAALNDSNVALTVGANAVPGNYLDGKASCCWLAAGLYRDTWVNIIYSQLRSVFRV